MRTEEIWSEDDGGGGGGGSPDPVIIGYDYFLDVWEAICMGQVEILKYYKNDDVVTSIPCTQQYFNDGTNGIYCSQPGANANAIPGVAHVYWDRMYLGENVTFVPTVHFVVRRTLSSPVDYANMSNGTNPAALIFSLLEEAGAQATDTVMSSFNAAASFWNDKGYGLNMAFSRKAKARDRIAKVLSYVDGVLYVDDADKFVLKAFDPLESSEETINTEDFLDFKLSRRGWNDTYNDFKGNYVDEDEDYSKRTLMAYNPANIRMTGDKRQRVVDLTAFRDKTTASKRLWDVMRWLSYPEAQIEFATTLKFHNLQPGSVVEINHTDYDIVSGEFRILTKDVSEIDSNKLKFKATQMVETLFDDHFAEGGGTDWDPLDITPDPLVYQKIFEMPYTSQLGHSPAYLVLAARVNSFETGYLVVFSPDNTDYQGYGRMDRWSQRGTLDETYVGTTDEIDDDIGILYTPRRFTKKSTRSEFSLRQRESPDRTVNGVK